MNLKNQTQTLGQWKSKYHNLLDSLNIGYLLIDKGYDCHDVNQTFLQMVGGTRAQYVGHNMRDWYSAEEFQLLHDYVEPTISNMIKGKSKNPIMYYQFEWFFYHSNGEKIPFLITCALNVDDELSLRASYATCVDIREQKRIQAELEKEKNMIETILFGIGDCVTIFDSKGKLLLTNQQGVEIRGGRKKPLLPLKVSNKTEMALTVNGEKRQFLGQIEAVRNQQGEILAYAEILKDVTSEIKLEETQNELFQIKREIKRLGLNSEMIGVSHSMRNVFDAITRCAEVDSTVLILGETGVGKELVARSIHNQSPRTNKPFVTVNCGALPESLLESELFGHVKGAFTGAVSTRKGLFREAEGGTLFLDEIGELNITMQVKLLRALQEREVRPVGSSKMYPIDVRVMAATHQNLAEMIKENDYRRDLYYRLAVISLMVPPLRERKEDILPLADHFLKKYSTRFKRKLKKLDHNIQQILLDYAWPGNIRELENCIEHTLAMTRGSKITPSSLPVQVLGLRNATPGNNPLSETQQVIVGATSRNDEIFSSEKTTLTRPGLKPWELEDKKAIEDSLIRNKGNRTRTAKDLGVCRATLWRKINLYQIR